MAIADTIASFKEATNGVQILTPEAPEWTQWRETRGQYGQERKPLGIAIPKTAEGVSRIVRWAKKSGIEITVRTGGNDFYGRNVVDGGLIIDMREIKAVEVAADKKTATVGGGVITKDLTLKLNEAGLCTPCGNTWIVGYVGWATLGGYGPLTGPFGMGYEQIVAAQVVKADGAIVDANEEMLEGFRGLGGNLGIVTSLTIKVYPSIKLYSGMIMFDATPENIRTVIAAQAKLGDLPKSLTYHDFIMKMQDRKMMTMFTWGDSDHEQGKQYLDKFTASMPPIVMSTVATKTIMEHYEQIPLHCLPWGAQRCLYVSEMSPKLVDLLVEGSQSMPAEPNMGWSMTIPGDHDKAPANMFNAGAHILFSFSDMVPKKELLAPARAWNDALYEKIRALDDRAILEASYPPLTRPGDRTTEQLLGDKFNKAKELKAKFDPEHVFKHALPPL